MSLKTIKNRIHRHPHTMGFTYVEVVIVVLLVGGGIAFLLNAVPSGIQVFSLGTQNHKLYYLAKEKMAEIKAQKAWIQSIDTDNPGFPSATTDLANQWKTDLDRDGRSFSSSVRGQVAVSILRSDLTPFTANDYLYTPREYFEITVTVSQGSQQSRLKSYLTTPASRETLLGQLYLIRRALILYAEDQGGYPATDELWQLVPSYLPFIPNDPYTVITSPVTTGIEDAGDYSYVNTGSTRTLYAKSHPSAEYPDLELVW